MSEHMPLRMAEGSTESTAARFVTLCLSARWDAGALEAARTLAAQDDLNWDALRQVAGREGVAPLLYHATWHSGLLPATVEGALRQAYHLNTARNLILLHRLELVLRRLAAEGVPVIVLKGAALAQQVYGKPGLRSMGDLDLLVRREDVPLTLQVLSRLGYEVPCLERRDGYADTYGSEVHLVKPGEAGAPLEIHWSLFGFLYYYHRVPMDWFWQTARPMRDGDVSVQMLGPTAQVLHLCAHILQHGGWSQAPLRWLHDVAEVVVFYRQQIDWDELLLRAQAYDLVLAVQQVLGHVSEEWQAPIPPTVLERLRTLRPSRGEEQVGFRLAAAHRPALHFWAGLLGSPDWRSRLGFAWRVVFPSADYMQYHYRIRHRLLLPLYYPYRWLSSLRRE